MRRTGALLEYTSEKAGRSNDGVRRRLSRYFVLGDGDGRFLEHTTVVGSSVISSSRRRCGYSGRPVPGWVDRLSGKRDLGVTLLALHTPASRW